MIKKMRICVCDICGVIEKPVYRGPFSFDPVVHEDIPDGWEHLGKKELMCPKCADAFNRMKKEGEHE